MRYLRNWREVGGQLRSRTPVRRLEFRNGAVLVAPAEAHLDFLFAEIWLAGVYTPSGYGLSRGDVVIDVGANVGVFTAYAAAQDRDIEVFAFEPCPANAAILRSNVATFPHQKVHVTEQAVAGSTCERVLSDHPTVWILHHLAEAGMGVTGLKVSCISLDDLMEENAIERCHLLKLDCEGSEYEILRSARPETLERIDKIVGEYHPVPGMSNLATAEDVLEDLLQSRGFVVEWMAPSDDGGGGIFRARRAALVHPLKSPRS